MIEGQAPAGVSEITSRLVSFSGPNGMQVVGYIDEGVEATWNERVAILAPRYGETKKNNLQLAYTLVANGFKVLRIDQTNHFGESDGTMDQFTLPGATDDLLAAVDYIDRYFEPDALILVTSSISARCGIRASALDCRITGLVNLVGVVDLDRTLQAIYQRDIFGEHVAGASEGSIDILGFEIDAANFHKSLVDAQMQDLRGTIEDAKKIKVPVLYLYAERDLWVNVESAKKVISQCQKGSFRVVPNVGHEVHEQPEAVRFTFDEIISFCRQGLPSDRLEIAKACKTILIQQNKIERARLQKILSFSNSEADFWGDYLGKFGIMEQAKYYIEYFSKMGTLIGAFRPADVILDAGCGNGFYGVGVLRSLSQHLPLMDSSACPFHYCGIDLTDTGLLRSYSRHVDEIVELQRESLVQLKGVSFSYRKLNFDLVGGAEGRPLPFSNGSINKVCSSLLISYLKEPVDLLREFYRVLKPGGVAVVSSMKPGCDMTVVYHDSVAAAYTEGNDRDAKVLLSAAGKIKVKKDVELYHFFTRQELSDLARDAGFTDIEVYRSFGDQANLMRIVK